MNRKSWLGLIALSGSLMLGSSARAEYPYPYPNPYPYPLPPLPAPVTPPSAGVLKPTHVAPHPSINPLVYAEERVLLRPLRDFVIPGSKHWTSDYIFSSDPSENLERKAMICSVVSSELRSEVGTAPRRLSRDRWYLVESAKRSGRSLYLTVEPVGTTAPPPSELKGPIGVSCHTICTPRAGDPNTDILGCRDRPTPSELACAFDLKVAATTDEPGTALLCPFRNASRQP